MENSKNYILEVSHLRHHVIENKRKFEIIDNLSFNVSKGEFLTLIGPSGCGKSVTLRIIAGLIKPSKGEVKMAAKKMGMVFQDYAIFPWLDAYQNIEFGLRMEGMPEKKRMAIITEKIGEMGLNGFEHNHPKELSGGMRQRVGIARALAINPDLLLMDEPFSNLDAFTAEKLREKIMEIWHKSKITVVMVTHLIDEAVEMSNRVVVLSSRPARVKSVVDIKLDFPRNTRSREFYQLADGIKSQIETVF